MPFSKTYNVPVGMIDTRRAIISAIVAFILTVIFYLALAFLTWIYIIPEGAARTLSLIINLLVSLFAGFLTAKNVTSGGIVNGLSSGIIYFLMMFVATVIITLKFPFNKALFVSLLTIVIGSSIGGIIGINVRANRRRRRSTYRRYR